MNVYEEGMFWAAAIELATTMKNKIDRTTNLRWGMESYSKSGCWELTTGTRLNTFVYASGGVRYGSRRSSFQHRLSRIVSVR